MFIHYLFAASFVSVYGVTIIQQPNNIICFPERDFCNFENFIDKTGKSLLVEVNRSGKVIGSAVGVVSGDVVAFEVNHPGGICWGDGTTLKVTPDIQHGDVVTIKDGALVLGGMTIQNGYITSYNLDGNTLRITGFVASTVIAANIEVRIVNRLLLGTTVQKRQVNAVPGPFVQETGYQSGIVITGTTFVATFVFNTQQAAIIAGSGEGYSVSLWQKTAPNGGRQGLTISEYGEVGGPFGSGCPAGPQNIGSPLVNVIAVSGNLIKWSPGKDTIGAPATTGFSINVIRGNEIYGYRVAGTVNQLIFNLVPFAGDDIIELRSMTGVKMSESVLMTYQPQSMIPTVSSLPVNNAVTEVETDLVILNSNTGQVVYTLDGSAVLGVNNKISPKAILYYKPISITKAITLKAISFDRSGNFSNELVGKFRPPTVLPQAITVAPKVVAVNGGITVSWVKPNDQSINAFAVETFTSAGVKVGVTRIISATSIIIKGLTVGTSYQFSVMTRSAGGLSAASPKSVSIVFPSPTDRVLITDARWIANKQFRISGTGSVSNAIITLYSTKADGTIGTVIFTRGTTTPISAPVTCVTGICTFTMDIRNAAVPSTNPGRVFIKSSRGGVDGPFTVVSR